MQRLFLAGRSGHTCPLGGGACALILCFSVLICKIGSGLDVKVLQNEIFSKTGRDSVRFVVVLFLVCALNGYAVCGKKEFLMSIT